MKLLLNSILIFITLALMECQQPTSLPNKGVRLFLPYTNLSVIPNYSIIPASYFHANDVTRDGINDALWCQSAFNSATIGMWYYPNGTKVPLFDGELDNGSAPRPLFSKRFNGQIALARRQGLTGIEGLYKCVIPDENGIDQILVVGAYRTATYNANEGPNVTNILFVNNIIEMFTFTFKVYDGPPTFINCTMNNTALTINSTDITREILNGSETITRMTVTIRKKQFDVIYQCSVSNERGSSLPWNITLVADVLKSLTYKRLSTGLTHVMLSWSPVRRATRYIVYANNSNVMQTTLGTTIKITSGLSVNTTCTFSVVPYISASYIIMPNNYTTITVPFITSNFSVDDMTITDIAGTTITLTWSPPTALVPTNYLMKYSCYQLCSNDDQSSIDTYSCTGTISQFVSTGIAPYSQCTFTLIGLYGMETIVLSEIISSPTSSIRNMTFLSIEASYMIVAWNEVPQCTGRNYKPIRGYLLTYTNASFTNTVNITVGRQYNLTRLRPYTNYTVTVRPYNNGHEHLPISDDVMQMTGQSVPGVISDLMSTGTDIQAINISWSLPNEPNGIITVYEIQYTSSNSINSAINTTSTQYSISGLQPNTNYTIRVRAYTNIGPGEWSQIQVSLIGSQREECSTNKSSTTVSFTTVLLLLVLSVIVNTMVCAMMFYYKKKAQSVSNKRKPLSGVNPTNNECDPVYDLPRFSDDPNYIENHHGYANISK